jgi:hypothetical protein
MNCDVLPIAPEWPEFIEQQTPFTMLECLLLPRRFSDESLEYSGLDEEVESTVSSVRYVVESLHDAIYEAATTLELDVAQVREVLDFLVGPGLKMLQGRSVGTTSDVD